MEPKDVFKDDVFQKTATTFVPGFLAISPYAAILLHRFPALIEIFKGSAVVAGAAIVSTAILGGMLCENLGSRIENSLWRYLRYRAKIKNAKDPEVEWNDYLELSDVEGIIGQSYLKSLLTRLKFELAMIPSLALFLIGLHCCDARIKFFINKELCLANSIVGCSIVYFVYEAKTTSKLLICVRSRVLHAKRKSSDGSVS
jgi:hypothetical protein